MKPKPLHLSIALGALLSLPAAGGTIRYVAIPASGPDAQRGISPDNFYTSAVSGGKANAGERTVNGVTLHALICTGNNGASDHLTLSAASGTLSNDEKSGSSPTVGAMSGVFSGYATNIGADDGSEQYLVLDPASLKARKTYDLRVYIANASAQKRMVNLTFAGDGKSGVSTGFFNEDDATTSAGGFTDASQAYYINYHFTWDGGTTPGFTVAQKFGGAPFVLFALTNQEMGTKAPPPPPASEQQGAPTDAALGDDSGPVASDTFYAADSLKQSGRWIEVGSYGLCWQPTGVAADWRPYTNGRWCHSSHGWVWDSDEPWAWATYHYGRWTRADDVGWFWVPGRVWAPSWCSWRSGDDYCGWAPLPPEAACNVNVGISTWVDNTWGIGPDNYNFCRVQDLGAANIQSAIIDYGQNANCIGSTSNVTNIVNNNAHIYSGGPNINAVSAVIQRVGSNQVVTTPIRALATAVGPTVGPIRTEAGGVKILAAPAPSAILVGNPHVQPVVAATFASPIYNHGWNGIKDANLATSLKQKMALETKGQTPENTFATLRGNAAKEDRAFRKPGDQASLQNSSSKLSEFQENTGSKLPPTPGKPIGPQHKPGTPISTLAKENLLGKTGALGQDDKKSLKKDSLLQKISSAADQKQSLGKGALGKALRGEDESRHLRKDDTSQKSKGSFDPKSFLNKNGQTEKSTSKAPISATPHVVKPSGSSTNKGTNSKEEKNNNNH